LVVYAPDFPAEDYLQPHEQMTLEMAFDELQHGLGLMQSALPEGVRPERLESLLSEARIAYDSGSEAQGSTLLQELDRLLFGTPKG